MRFQRFFGDSLLAGGTFGNVPLLDFTEDRIAVDFKQTFDAGRGREGSMALYNLLREYSCISFNVVDILRVIGQQLPLVLKKSNESMGRRPFLFGWENILCNGEENTRVFPEDIDIKDLLGIT